MIELLVRGERVKVPLTADGQLELPRQPPDFAGAGWAAKATVALGTGDPNLIRLFDAWYFRQWRLDVSAGDGRGTWIRASMACVEVDWQKGIQATRAWTPPLRRKAVPGQSALYRPTPRFQRIEKPACTYLLAAERWAAAPEPEEFANRRLVLEAVN